MKRTNKLNSSNKSATPSRRTVVIFSRHPSHSPLRRSILTKIKALVRFGSQTVPQTKYSVELNSPEAVRNSADKLRMKQCFTSSGVKTAAWCKGTEEWKGDFPVVVKHRFGSRGRGNYKIDSKEELKRFFAGKDASSYIIEKFHGYNREYRLHVDESGYFYTCRKMLKNETPDDKRWFRNDSNSVWIVETNPQFAKPSNFNSVVAESVKALKSVGLDFGAVDVRIQSDSQAKKGSPEFIIIEINSAPGLGKVGIEIYKKRLLEIINHKNGKI